MKRLIICICSLFCLIASPCFAITTVDDFVISAFKNEGISAGQWVKVQVQNLSGELLGPGRSLDLGDGTAWATGFSDCFMFEVTGNEMQKVTVSFEFENFKANDDAHSEIAGNIRFKPNGFTSDYGTDSDKNYRYLYVTTGSWMKTKYTYREQWPISSYTATSPKLAGGTLSAAGEIMQKKGNNGTYTNQNLHDAQETYTRMGIVQLQIDAQSYEAAPYDTVFASTVRVTCTVS